MRLAEEEHALLITMHHIVSDGWSIGVLMNELSALYGAFVRGEAGPAAGAGRAVRRLCSVAAAVDGRRDFAAAGGVLESGRWRSARAAGIADGPSAASGTGLCRRLGEVGAGGGADTGLEGAEQEARDHALHDLAGGMGALLARLSGQEDMVIGVPVANRGRMEIEGLIGFFVNTLALRMDVSGSRTVSELLECG